MSALNLSYDEVLELSADEPDRTEAERVQAQKGARVVNCGAGLYAVLDGDNHPIEFLNHYLEDLVPTSSSDKHARNTAYNFARLIRVCGKAGVDVLHMPNKMFASYFEVRRNIAGREDRTSLQLSSAHAELARLHGGFTHAISNGYAEDLPYPIEIVEPSERTCWESHRVPRVLPRRRKKKVVYLPPKSHFRRFSEALSREAAFMVRVMRGSGARIFELFEIQEKWRKRIRTASGIASLMIKRKGGVIAPIYFPAALADALDAYFTINSYFLNESGKPWSLKTLSDRFTAARKVVQPADYNGPKMSAHMLRHGYASAAFEQFSELRQAGVVAIDPIFVVQNLLGHASDDTTWNTYIHMFPMEELTDEDRNHFNLGSLTDLLAATELWMIRNRTDLAAIVKM
jgi:integrase